MWQSRWLLCVHPMPTPSSPLWVGLVTTPRSFFQAQRRRSGRRVATAEPRLEPGSVVLGLLTAQHRERKCLATGAPPHSTAFCETANVTDDNYFKSL